MRALCLILSLTTTAVLGAQQPAPAGPGPGPSLVPEQLVSSPDSAVLSVGNRTVFVFRARFGALGARDRAEMALERIKRSQRAGDDSVRIVRDTLGAIIMVNDSPVFVVTPQDLPVADSLTPEVAAIAVVAQLREGLGAAEEALNVKALAIGAASVVAATLLLLFLLRMLRRGRAWLLDLSARKLPELKVREVELLSPSGLRRGILVLLRILSWTFGLLLTYGWITFSLTRFSYTRPWGMVFGGFLADTASRIGLSILHSIPNLITIGLIFLAARGILVLLNRLFDAVEDRKSVV